MEEARINSAREETSTEASNILLAGPGEPSYVSIGNQDRGRCVYGMIMSVEEQQINKNILLACLLFEWTAFDIYTTVPWDRVSSYYANSTYYYLLSTMLPSGWTNIEKTTHHDGPHDERTMHIFMVVLLVFFSVRSEWPLVDYWLLVIIILYDGV